MQLKSVSIVGISFSVRPDSNSARLLQEALGLVCGGEGLVIEPLIDLSKEQIACSGCETCYEALGTHGDVIDRAIEGIRKAQVVVISTPTCYGMPPAAGKVLIDRMDPIFRESLRTGTSELEGKGLTVIVTGATEVGSDPSINQCASNVTEAFKQHGFKVVGEAACIGGTLAYEGYRLPEKLPKGAMEVVEELAGSIKRFARRVLDAKE